MDPDKIAVALLVLLDILRQNPDARNINRAVFMECFPADWWEKARRQYKLHFSQVLSRVLMYVVRSGVPNRSGKGCIGFITAEYIGSLRKNMRANISSARTETSWNYRFASLRCFYRRT